MKLLSLSEVIVLILTQNLGNSLRGVVALPIPNQTPTFDSFRNLNSPPPLPIVPRSLEVADDKLIPRSTHANPELSLRSAGPEAGRQGNCAKCFRESSVARTADAEAGWMSWWKRNFPKETKKTPITTPKRRQEKNAGGKWFSSLIHREFNLLEKGELLSPKTAQRGSIDVVVNGGPFKTALAKPGTKAPQLGRQNLQPRGQITSPPLKERDVGTVAWSSSPFSLAHLRKVGQGGPNKPRSEARGLDQIGDDKGTTRFGTDSNTPPIVGKEMQHARPRTDDFQGIKSTPLVAKNDIKRANRGRRMEDGRGGKVSRVVNGGTGVKDVWIPDSKTDGTNRDRKREEAIAERAEKSASWDNKKRSCDSLFKRSADTEVDEGDWPWGKRESKEEGTNWDGKHDVDVERKEMRRIVI